jgi:uncharacterized protein (TIGR02145 family)
MKETGTTHWYSPNTGATNESGFTALADGYRYDGIFYSIGSYGRWWSITAIDASYALLIDLFYKHVYVDRYGSNKINGYSVRCLKN